MNTMNAMNFIKSLSDINCEGSDLDETRAKYSKYEYVSRLYYSDRLFSQILRHFYTFFAAKILGKSHIHWPFPKSTPIKELDINECFDSLFDVSMVTDRQESYETVLNLNRSQKIATWCDQTVGNWFSAKELFSSTNIDLMRRAYKWTTHTPTFDPNAKLNVAIHIRRGDITSETNSSRYTHLDFFSNCITKLYKLHPFAHFHIYSDSDISLDLSKNVLEGANIRYHVLENLLQTIHDMCSSDVLIMSIGSNMSFLAGLISHGIVFFDRRKLNAPLNSELNKYWSKHPQFIRDETIFLNRVQKLMCI